MENKHINLRISELEKELNRRGNFSPAGINIGGRKLSPQQKLQYLENVLAFEKKCKGEQQIRLLDLYAEINKWIALPPAAELDDNGLRQKLRAVTEFMAKMHVIPSMTVHLSDRELYHELFTDMLRRPIELHENPRGRLTVFRLNSANLEKYDGELAFIEAKAHPEGRNRDSKTFEIAMKNVGRNYPKLKTQWRWGWYAELPRENYLHMVFGSDGKVQVAASIPS